MKAKDVFKIAQELPQKELYTLISLIENHISRHKTAVKITEAIITNTESTNYLLKNVFKVNIKEEKWAGGGN